MRRSVLLLFIVLLMASCVSNVKDNIVRNSPPGDSTWYSVKFRALCDSTERGEVRFDKVARYDTYSAYDTVVTLKTDSVSVSFDFIADCCLTFSGRAQVLNDTLFLTYGMDREYTEACSCFCDYRLNYQIKKANLAWDEMKIVHRRLAFKDDLE